MGAGDQAASRASSEANQRLEGCKADMAGKRVGLPGDRGCQIPRIWIFADRGIPRSDGAARCLWHPFPRSC